MHHLIGHLIHTLGVFGVALAAGLEGETAVVIGGALARHGLFPMPAAAVAAALGSFVADQIFFALGRGGREGRLVQRVRAKPVFARALTLIERHPVAFCLAFRFVYGFRVAGPVAIGVSAVPTRTFVALNLLSASVWGALFTWLGWRFGRAFERVVAMLLTPAHIAAAIAVVALALLAFLLWRRRRAALVAET